MDHARGFALPSPPQSGVVIAGGHRKVKNVKMIVKSLRFPLESLKFKNGKGVGHFRSP
jgi:hypothetical protein